MNKKDIPVDSNSNKLTNKMQQLTGLLLDVLFHSTCSGRLHAHHQELTTALTASGFTLERGGSSVVGRGLASGHVERHKTSSNKLVKVLHLVG
jgi:hypothetical protein